MITISIIRDGETYHYWMVAHAYEQMIEDSVSQTHIEQALAETDPEPSSSSDNWVYRLKISSNRAIAVVVSEDEQRIVTVYYYQIKS